MYQGVASFNFFLKRPKKREDRIIPTTPSSVRIVSTRIRKFIFCVAILNPLERVEMLSLLFLAAKPSFFENRPMIPLPIHEPSSSFWPCTRPRPTLAARRRRECGSRASRRGPQGLA